MPTAPELLVQANTVLSKCGRPIPPQKGLSVIYIPKSFFVQFVLPISSTQVITKEVVGETTWSLRAISIVGANPAALDIQIQLPDGRFLINSLQDITQIAGFGSGRYPMTEELDCPPETTIKVTLDDTFQAASSAQPVSILFEGAYKYYLRQPQIGCPIDLASASSRYQGHPNQAIMGSAPWMFGLGPRTPDGYSDEEFTYGIQQVTISLSGPYVGTGTVQIDQTSDFEVRRILVSVTADSGVSAATVLCRFRAGSGYAFNDEPIDAAQYLCGAPLAHDWEIKKGDTVYVDLELVDYSGTGNAYIQTFLEGVKRKRVS
jgi:hypothetical protein